MKTTVVAHVAAWVQRRHRALSRSCLLALTGLLLLASLPASASASGLEMRGEWALALDNGKETIKAVAIISTEANGSGEFASSSMFLEGVVPGSFSGTLTSETTASVKVTSQAYGPFPAGEFTSSSMEVHGAATPPSMNGSGTLKSGGNSTSATLTATRIHTYKEVEEREEREQREREEAELRENVRGEWSLTLESGAQTVHGIARITKEASPSNEFASSAALFEGAVPGSFSGTLELKTAKVEVTSQAYGAVPASKFRSSAMTVEAKGASMSGSGSLTISPGTPEEVTVPATLTATRTHNYTELKALEKLEREAKEKAEREAREKAEAEAKAKLESEASKPTSGTAATVAVKPVSQTLTVGSSGVLSLPLSNPNAFAVKGSVKLTMVEARRTGKSSGAKSKRAKSVTAQIGKASFSVAASGRISVKLTLSKGARAALAHHKTLSVTATIVTGATGGQSATKAYKLTLRPAPASHRH